MTEYKQSGDINNEAERLRLIGLTANSASRETLTKLAETGFAPARILDAGCGTGDAFEVISEIFPDAELVGMDQSDKAADVAGQKEGVSKVITGDITSIPESLVRGSFDLVFVRNTLLHVRDLSTAIKELSSLLVDGGKLVVQEPDWGYADANWTEFIIFRDSITAAMTQHGINPNVGGEIENLLVSGGLQNVSSQTFENRTNAGDEGWAVIDFLLDVSGGMIVGELSIRGVDSVDEMKARVAEAAKDSSNYFDNPAWIVAVGNNLNLAN